MKPHYCYWSVATGDNAALMERCVRTARAAGVFREFQVLTDRPIEGCECYEAHQCDPAHGLHQLHYLKAGMTRLDFEHFVWLDPGTVFTRKPDDVLGALGRSPIHVPLELGLASVPAEAGWQGMPLGRLRDLLATTGVPEPLHLGGSGFWIVHHDVIELVYELAMAFWHKGREAGLTLDVSAGLACALQLLCADPHAHRLDRRPDLWAADTTGIFRDGLPDDSACTWRHPLGGTPVEVRPALVQLAAAPA